MSNLEALRNSLRDGRNPGHEIGTFLLEHTNNLPYLVAHLENYLAAAKADLESERSFGHNLFQGLLKKGNES